MRSRWRATCHCIAPAAAGPNRIEIVDLPLFSRYVFCRCSFEDRPKVLQIATITSIVGFGGKPCPIPDAEIETLKSLVGSGLPVSPWPFLRIWQRVRVCDGVLQGLQGILERKKSGYRVIVNIATLYRAVSRGSRARSRPGRRWRRGCRLF